MIAPRYVGASTATWSPRSSSEREIRSMHSIPPLVSVSCSHAGSRPCCETRSSMYSRTLRSPSEGVYWSAICGSSRTSRVAISASSSVGNVAAFGNPPVIPSVPGGGPARMIASSGSVPARARVDSICSQSMTEHCDRSAGAVEGRMRDDRVFGSTKVLGAVIVPFLLVAFALLYFFPDDTRHYFAWNVQPELTPMIMGAGYIAGAYFFARVAFATRFHRVHVGFLPVTAFTIFMAAGSFAHLDRFLQDHVAFWIWMGLYVTTPILVPLAWIVNRRTDPGTPEPGERRLSLAVRRTLVGAGAFQSLVALALLFSPSTMID